jgi:hypothetical protein
MKKIIISETKRKAVIQQREKAILESFSKIFNKIKRVDENYYEESQEPIEEDNQVLSDYESTGEEDLNKNLYSDIIAWLLFYLTKDDLGESYARNMDQMTDNANSIIISYLKNNSRRIGSEYDKLIMDLTREISKDILSKYSIGTGEDDKIDLSTEADLDRKNPNWREELPF